MILVPNMPSELKYCIYPKKEINYEVILNCVDISNRKLVRSWLVRIMPDKPIIKKYVKLECRANRKNNIKYEYENEVNSWIIYNFESSHPEIFKVN